jgi:hypothetical protein
VRGGELGGRLHYAGLELSRHEGGVPPQGQFGDWGAGGLHMPRIKLYIGVSECDDNYANIKNKYCNI